MQDKYDNQIISPNSQYPAPIYKRDTIDLVDVYLLIDKRRKILILVVICFMLVGFLSTISKQPVYLYTTTIAIGSSVSKNRASGFESIQTVQNKIEKSFIPLVLSQYASEHPGERPDDYIGNIKVSIPKRSEVVVLTSKAKAKHGDIIKMLQQRVVDMLSKDHEYILNSLKLGYEGEISLSEIELGFLKNEATIKAEDKSNESKLVDIETSYQRLMDPGIVAVKRKKLERNVQIIKDNLNYLIDVEKKLTKDLGNLKSASKDLQLKINQLNDQITKSLEEREQAAKDVGKQTEAMTLLMIDNRIQQSQRFLIQLEKEFYTENAERMSNLTVEIRNNKRAQDAAIKSITEAEMRLKNFKIEQELTSEPTRAKIDSLKANIELSKIARDRKIAKLEHKIKENRLQLENLQPTRAVTPPMRSLRPRGMGRARKIFVFAIVGLVFGIVLVMLLEFLEKVRERRSGIAGGSRNK